VAVQEAVPVDRPEAGEYPERHLHGFGRGERSRLQPVGQRLAIEPLHRDEETPLVFAELVDVAHVRMADGTCGSSLTPEALAHRLLVERGLHYLDRDGTFETIVPRVVDEAHPALPERPEDAVTADGCGH